MDGRTICAAARLAGVFALLAGLAVMHVLPSSASCPQAGTGGGASTMSMTSGGHGSSGHDAMAIGAVAGSTATRPASVSVPGSAAAGGMRGDACSAILQSAGIIGLLVLIALGFLLGDWPTWPRAAATAGRGPRLRAPPRAGALLLHDLCVWRT